MRLFKSMMPSDSRIAEHTGHFEGCKCQTCAGIRSIPEPPGGLAFVRLMQGAFGHETLLVLNILIALLVLIVLAVILGG